MPVAPTYPGVYVEERPPGARAITGVPTAVAAFIDWFPRGPIDTPVEVLSWADVERTFGGLHDRSEASYALDQFFRNGGARAVVVRVGGATAPVPASVMLRSTPGGGDALLVAAANPGVWGNQLRVRIEPMPIVGTDARFALVVREFRLENGREVVLREERHSNLSTDAGSPRSVEPIINTESQLIRVTDQAGVVLPPAASGVVGAEPAAVPLAAVGTGRRVMATLVFGAGATADVRMVELGAGAIPSLQDAASILQSGLRTALATATPPPPPNRPEFSQAVVLVTPDNRLQVIAGTGADATAHFRFSAVAAGAIAADPTTAIDLGLATCVAGTALNPATFPLAALAGGAARRISVTRVDSAGPGAAQSVSLGATAIASIQDAANRLQVGLRAATFADAAVRVSPSLRLQVSVGGTDPTARFTFAADAADPATVNSLGLTAPETLPTVNVSAYQVGSAAAAFLAQGAAVPGTDGTLPTATQLIGSQSAIPPTGMFALDTVDIFNVLCLPRVSKVSGSRNNADNFQAAQVPAVIGAAIPYCASKRAMLLLDPPTDVTTVPALRTWINANATLRADNAALYWPRLLVGDPLDEFRLRSVAPSGTAVGLWSRTDNTRGVWKAPAGTDAQLRGVNQLAYQLTDAEQGLLNPIAINAFRNFDQYGMVSWGARTLHGEDVRGSQWRYLPVRRVAYFIEETLFRSTKWVIFEPNDEPLWSQIRLSVGAFMKDLFEKGYFAGATRDEAYFVRCDASTTTPLDQERGVVNLVVGFSPLRPAEFLVITIQQISRLEA